MIELLRERWRRLARRDRRLVLLAAVSLAVALGTLWLRPPGDEEPEVLAELRERIRAEGELARRLPTLRREHRNMRKRLEERESARLSAETPAVALARMQTALNELAETGELNLVSVTPRETGRSETGWWPLTIELRGWGPVRTLMNFYLAVERDLGYRIVELDLRSGHYKDPRRIETRAVFLAMYRGGEAGDARTDSKAASPNTQENRP